jgi:hypothetical protein
MRRHRAVRVPDVTVLEDELQSEVIRQIPVNRFVVRNDDQNECDDRRRKKQKYGFLAQIGNRHNSILNFGFLDFGLFSGLRKSELF